mgnify:CR=1 FL=1
MTSIRFGIRYWLQPNSVSAGKRRSREGIDVITIPDVPAGELNAAVNIRILLTADQGPHGLGSPVLGLHLNRDQALAVRTKKSCSSVESSRL